MLDGHNIFFLPPFVSSSSFLATETPSSELEQGVGEGRHTHTHKGNRCIGDARRSLIFYDCLKCSASHNFAFADSNSRCVLSWRLRTSRGSLSLSRFRLVISSAILLNSQEDLEIHLTDSIVCPLHDPIIFFFFYFLLSLLCAYFWNNFEIITIIINSLK